MTSAIVCALAAKAFGGDVAEMEENEITERIANLDRKDHFKLFEAACAHKMGCLLWENLPCEALEKTEMIRYRNGFPDFGIDNASVALDRVVQCKFYQPGGFVKPTDVSSFFTLASAFSEVLKKKVNMFLIVSEGVKLHRMAGYMCRVHGIDVIEMKNDEFAKIIASCLQTYVPLPPIEDEDISEFLVPELRNYQRGAIKALEVASETKNRVLRLSAACGTGKTAIGAVFMKNQIDAGTLTKWAWLVPSINLLIQAKEALPFWAPGISVGFLGGNCELEEGEEYQCIVSTYQSVKQIAEKEFDVIVVDEGHHVEPYLSDEKFAGNDGTANGWLRQIAGMKTNKFLLMSATMREEDELKYAYSYQLEEAITNENLCDYEICIPVFTSGNKMAALKKLINNTPAWSSILAYCNDIASAKKFVKLLNYGDDKISAEFMDGKTLIGERQQIIKRFEGGKTRVLVTVWVLSEGVDVPSADTCMFVDQRSSHINVVQCVGRILRLHPDKQIAHVVLPSTSEEKELARFLRIMNKHDSRIARSIAGKKKGRVNFVLEDAKEEDAELLFENLFDRFGHDIVRGDWDATFKVLERFVGKNKKIPVRNDTVGNIRIGEWVDTQRRFKREEKLADEIKIQKLESLPGWKWDAADYDEKWNRKFELLKRYVEEKGKLPVQSTIYGGENLGKWVWKQKAGKNGIDNRKMDDDRAKMLESLPGWKWEDDKDAEWFSNLDALKRFVSKNGRLPKPKDVIHIDGKDNKIGIWTTTQRVAKRGKSSFIMDEKKEKELESVKFWEWDPHAKKWNDMFALLVEYMEENGGEMPVQSIKFGGKALGAWVNTQRRAAAGNKKAGKMDPTRKKKLESIPSWKW